MAVTFDEVTAQAMALPEVVQGLRWGRRTWFAGTKAFLWERPFSKADIKRYGEQTPPGGDIVGLAVADLAEKEAVLGQGFAGVFTIEHFNGHPAVLVQLEAVDPEVWQDLVVDAWLACAPAELAQRYAEEHGLGR